MDDFDFDFDWDMPGDLYDISSLGDIDWGSVLSDIDLSDINVGDINLSDLGNFAEDVEQQAGGFYGNIPGRAEYDPFTDTTELYDPVTDTIRTITHGGGRGILEGFDESEFTRDIGDDGVGTVEIVGERPDTLLTDEEQTRQFDLDSLLTDDEHTRQIDLDSILTDDEHTRVFDTDKTDQEDVVITGTRPTGDDDLDNDENPPVVCPPNSDRKVPQPDGSTWVYNCKGELINKIPPTKTPDPQCPPNSNKKTTLPNGWTIVTDCKGNVISSTGPGTTTTTTTPPLQNYEMLLALLGGILGLTNRKVDTPRTFTGTIPKYVATRGPSRSPTEGGRRPGGAGLGSLTGGVTYTPVGAAYGGLMGLADGGKARPARYLRGGTDGMADKIQTDIDGKQPARLSHGEFVIPADVVSHLGNGNSDAGADVLYDMMAKVRKARTGTPKQGKQINPRKYLPK